MIELGPILTDRVDVVIRFGPVLDVLRNLIDHPGFFFQPAAMSDSEYDAARAEVRAELMMVREGIRVTKSVPLRPDTSPMGLLVDSLFRTRTWFRLVQRESGRDGPVLVYAYRLELILDGADPTLLRPLLDTSA